MANLSRHFKWLPCTFEGREDEAVEPLQQPKLVTDAEAPKRGGVVAAYFARVRVPVWEKE
jgi:hypothetical protein